MRDKVLAWCRENGLFSPGDRVICAVSGGADSVALLWCLLSLAEALSLSVSAAHFNHGLRGAESDRDEAFVLDFCRKHEIPCRVGRGEVKSSGTGLEDAARQARYDFLLSLDPGAKIATAHRAEDNAETLLLHLLRGTSLDGLCGIPPRRGPIVRPMLPVTREEVLRYLEEYHLPHVEDSSNGSDDFLRNRLRHRVLPELTAENPAFCENTVSLTARLRRDRDFLSCQTEEALTRARIPNGLSCAVLRALDPALRSRTLGAYLREGGLSQPESAHIRLAEGILNALDPSARGNFPGGLVLRREYDLLTWRPAAGGFAPVTLAVPGVTKVPELGLTVTCGYVTAPAVPKSTGTSFLLNPETLSGPIGLRPRRPGDRLSRPGGTKSLKELLIDRKIPAEARDRIPVLWDDRGILGVYSIGPDQTRYAMGGRTALSIVITVTERG